LAVVSFELLVSGGERDDAIDYGLLMIDDSAVVHLFGPPPMVDLWTFGASCIVQTKPIRLDTADLENAKQTQFPRFWAKNGGGGGKQSQFGPWPGGLGKSGARIPKRKTAWKSA